LTQTEAAQLARTMASTVVRQLVDSSQRAWPEDVPMFDAADEDMIRTELELIVKNLEA
jgi:hypothetical protein